MVLPKVTMRPGETQLWRLANASAAVWYDIAVQDAAKTSRPFTIVARDGNRLVAPQRVAHEPLGPGQRIDVLVRAPRSGPLTLTTLSFQQGQTATFPATDLATVEIAGASARDVASPPRRGKLPEFPAKRGPTRTWRFSYVVNNKIPTFFINDQPFSPARVDAKPRLGTTERWVFVNESTEWHPIHVHQDDFRVLSVNGKRVSARSDQDVVALPPMRGTKKGTVEIDMPFVKYSGNFVLHCHILDHEDGGMMARINVRE
jgi:FtsP/CotA-like multicopper oxidase with cupredoxin domain